LKAGDGLHLLRRQERAEDRVSITPGAIAFTRILSGASSIARFLDQRMDATMAADRPMTAWHDRLQAHMEPVCTSRRRGPQPSWLRGRLCDEEFALEMTLRKRSYSSPVTRGNGLGPKMPALLNGRPDGQSDRSAVFTAAFPVAGGKCRTTWR